MKKFYVIKKSVGYAVKTLPTVEAARHFAALCCKNYGNSNYIVCTYAGGMFHEI